MIVLMDYIFCLLVEYSARLKTVLFCRAYETLV